MAAVTVIAATLIAVQSSGVQTRLAEKAIGILEDRIDGNISIGKLQFSPVKAVVLKDVVITDRNPYRAPDGTTANDTLFRAGYITARFSLKSLTGAGGIRLASAGISDAMMYLAIEPERDSAEAGNNLKRIFRLDGSGRDRDKTPNDNDIFSVSDIKVENLSFVMENFRKDRSRFAEYGINWFDMDVSGICLSGKDLRMKGRIMSGTCSSLSFREKSGYSCGHISGKAEVGNGLTLISGFRFRDGRSDIDIPELRMTYEDTKSWADFTSAVRMTGHIAESKVSLGTLKYFAPALRDKSMDAVITGDVDGYVNDLRIRDMQFSTVTPVTDSTGGQTSAKGISGRLSGSLRGLPDTGEMIINADVRNIGFTSEELENFIKGWAAVPGLDIKKWCRGDRLSFRGTANGRINSFDVNGKITAGQGNVLADVSIEHLLDKNIPLKISGNVSSESLDIRRILGKGPVGECDMRSALSASIGNGAAELTVDSLSVSSLDVLGYRYRDIAAAGVFSNQAFNGRIVCSDPNLKFLFQGIFTLSSTTRNALYRFYAMLGYADLNALNIDRRGTSKMSLTTQANFTRISGKDLLGNIDIRDIVLEDTHGIHNVGDVSIVSHSNDNVNRIRLSSQFAEGSFVGTEFLSGFIRDLKIAGTGKALPSLFQADAGERENNNYNLSLKFHDTKDILSFFAPGAYIADSTAVDLKLDRDGSLNGSLRSGRLAIKDKYLKDIDLRIDNSDGKLGCTFTSGEMALSPALIKSARLAVAAEADSVRARFTYDNGTSPANRGTLSAYGYLDRDNDGRLNLRAGIRPSEIVLNSAAWQIHSSDILYNGSSAKIGRLEIGSSDQSIRLEGGWAAHDTDTLHLNLDRFDLSMLNAFQSKDLGIRGKTTGHAMLVSPTGDNIGILLNLTSEDSEFAGRDLGTVRIASVWEDSSERFNIICRNSLGGVQNLDARGYFYPKNREAEVRLKLDGLDLGYTEPFLSSIFSGISGGLSGNIVMHGPLNRLEISSDGLALDRAKLKIGYTGVEYTASGPLRLDSHGIWFDRIGLSDRFNEEGSVTGSVGWDYFRNLTLDTYVRFNRMQVLNLEEKDNPVFYGGISASGELSITGPLNALMLNATARTEKNGAIHIPIGGSSSASISNLLTFKEKETRTVIDPYEELMKKLKSKEKKANEFGIKLNVTATPEVEAHIEIDKATGNVLTGRGSGNIGLEIFPSRKVFNINGSYNITGGNYHFVALGIAKRDFTIQDGSSVRFNGEVMDSDLNINAVYRTKASVATLIADTTATSTRRTVECGISISDKLKNPRLDFSINIPDLDPTTQTRVESALNTQDKVQKQLLALLISNSFLPDEQSGITNSSSSMLYSNVTEAMAGQLNNILQKLEIPLDFGLDYQQNSVGTDIFDVALSTALFNNRVTVNGTIGNRQFKSSSSSSGSEMVGDLDIDVKLDKPGSLRLNLFSHSADQYTNYLDNTQRNGIGLTYQKEFDNIRDFFRNMFRSGKKRRAEEAARQPSEAGERMTVINIGPEDSGKDKNQENNE